MHAVLYLRERLLQIGMSILTPRSQTRVNTLGSLNLCGAEEERRRVIERRKLRLKFLIKTAFDVHEESLAGRKLKALRSSSFSIDRFLASWRKSDCTLNNVRARKRNFIHELKNKIRARVLVWRNERRF